MKRWITVTGALVMMATLAGLAKADWYFRGTPNGWSADSLDLLSGTEYQTCQTFGEGDANGGPRFKIDRYGDWTESYPVADYAVNANQSVRIHFDSTSGQITTESVSTCDSPASQAWYFRGTSNDWGASAMTPSGEQRRCITESFGTGDTGGEPRFKIDRFGDWSESYPATDYIVTANTRYEVCIDTVTKQVTATEAADSDLVLTTLGAEYSPTATTFAIWSPESSQVGLVVDGIQYSLPRLADQLGYTRIYGIELPGDWHGAEYTFTIDGVPVRDPYGKMALPNQDVNIVMDMSRTDPVGGWVAPPPLVEREDAVIYEIHIRDFTIDATSGVSDGKRGTYLGMVEGGTTYQGVATGIDHLKSLGVTHVQILPFYDFSTCSDPADTDCYNWGYDPRNFNVPEERYATSTDIIERVRQVKTMINEFHKAGIRVVMDVVYNHTFDNEMFENISMQYYTDTDLSGTGNSIDANVPMVGRMIRDSLEYWTREYRLDGYRFDLVGIFDHDEYGDWGRYLNQQFPDRNLLLYGEPWNGYASDPREAERVRLGTLAREQSAHVGVFNPRYREAIKGNNDDGYGGGFAFNQGDVWAMDFGSRAGIRYTNDPDTVIDLWDPMFATDPEQSINYVSAHDNLALRDKILAWAALNNVPADSDYLRRIHNFANGIVLTSQGIPFLHGGVEMLRDKDGDHNSFRSPDSVNKIRWNWAIDNADIVDYYRDVIALRNAHPGFRMNTWEEIDQHVTTTRYSDSVLVTDIDAAANGDSWSRILVIYNAGGNEYIALPTGDWQVAMEKNDPNDGNGRTVSGSVLAEGTAVTVLYQP